jgi:hypothetical protein
MQGIHYYGYLLTSLFLFCICVLGLYPASIRLRNSSNIANSEAKEPTRLLNSSGSIINISTTHQSITGDFIPNPEDFAYCTATNEVPNRSDSYGVRSSNATRPFSLNALDFEEASSSRPVCSTVSSLLEAIKHGTRAWDDPHHETMQPLERESVGSHFVPARCRIPYISPHRACESMNRYRTIVWFGDSFTRHLVQGILINLRNDFILGGILSSDVRPYSYCRCDGQFSEHAFCRLNNGYFQNLKTPFQLGVCSHLPPPGFGWSSSVGGDQINRVFDTPHCNTTDADARKTLVVLQGGLHLGTNAARAFNAIVRPVLQHPGYTTCPDQYQLVWLAYNAQSRSTDAKYPRQSRENGLVFNQEMQRLLLPHGIPILDWWNLTADAQTSDGVHYLVDVNYAKAQHLLYLAELLSKEQ